MCIGGFSECFLWMSSSAGLDLIRLDFLWLCSVCIAGVNIEYRIWQRQSSYRNVKRESKSLNWSTDSCIAYAVKCRSSKVCLVDWFEFSSWRFLLYKSFSEVVVQVFSIVGLAWCQEIHDVFEAFETLVPFQWWWWLMDECCYMEELVPVYRYSTGIVPHTARNRSRAGIQWNNYYRGLHV